MRRAPGDKITSYEEGIKRIAAFSSAESFWGLWTHLEPPSKLQPTTDYLLFHQGIRRPVWEDPLNIRGGKWIVRLKKGVADRIWEDLILAIVGDQFDACQAAEGAVEEELRDAPEICGCTISVRQSEDIISLWNKTDGDLKLREKIRCVACLSCSCSSHVYLGIPCGRCSTFQPPQLWSTNPTMVRSSHPSFRVVSPLFSTFHCFFDPT